VFLLKRVVSTVGVVPRDRCESGSWVSGAGWVSGCVDAGVAQVDPFHHPRSLVMLPHVVTLIFVVRVSGFFVVVVCVVHPDASVVVDVLIPSSVYLP